MGIIKKIVRSEDLTPEEAERIRRFLTKQAKEVRESPKRKAMGREIKGGMNLDLGKGLGYKYK